MGYRSRIVNFEQFEFRLPEGTTKEDVLKLVAERSKDHAEDLPWWFDIEIDEEGHLELEPVGESGKAYVLPQAVDTLIKALKPLQTDSEGLSGLRVKFELWGEEAGDATLYRSDGEKLLAIAGEMTFPGEAKPV